MNTLPNDQAPGLTAYAHRRDWDFTEIEILVMVQMSPATGAFELRYLCGDGQTILARAPITITPVSATLAAPNSAPMGSEITVEWTAPAFDGDFIAIAEPISLISLENV